MKLSLDLQLEIGAVDDDQEASDADVREAVRSVPWCPNCEASVEPYESGECPTCGHCVGYRPEGSL